MKLSRVLLAIAVLIFTFTIQSDGLRAKTKDMSHITVTKTTSILVTTSTATIPVTTVTTIATTTTQPIATTTSIINTPQASIPPAIYNGLMCIASYESHDNWADSGSEYMGGGLQFNIGTWESVGGVGYPAQASEVEQLYRGYLLYLRDGWSPWTTASLCGL